MVGNLNLFPAPQEIYTLGAIVQTRHDDSPLSFYGLLFSDELLDLLVIETNRYAYQQIIDGIANESISKNSILANWTDTDGKEILKFIGILIWM